MEAYIYKQMSILVVSMLFSHIICTSHMVVACYHDRVYKQNGSSKEEFEQCTMGDVMAVEYDVTTHELKFLKNEKEVT